MNLTSNQSIDGPHCLAYYGGKTLWKSINYSVTAILQNIFVCVQQKKEFHAGLEQHEGE